MKTNPIRDFGIGRGFIRYTGHELKRPECILAEPDGTLWSPMRVEEWSGLPPTYPSRSPRKTVRSISIRQRLKRRATWKARFRTAAFAKNGDFLISNFGTDCLEIMSRDGGSRVLADSIDGEPIGKLISCFGILKIGFG